MNSRNKKDKSPETPLFIVKLIQILENKDLDDIVGWTTTNDSFIIRNVSRFTEEVLPAYYKHHNFASFIRQANIYSFKKVRHSDGENVYAHEKFIRSKPHLIKEIIRKPRQEKEDILVEFPTYLTPQNGDKAARDISELKIKQNNLYEMCKQFLYHNQKLMDENEVIVQKLESEYSEKEKRLEEFLIYLVAQKGYRSLTGLTDSNVLSIHHYDHLMKPPSEKSQATPLELIANNMDQDQNFKKMKILLQNAVDGRSTRRRVKNFTIVPQKLVDKPAQNNQEPILIDRTEQIADIPFSADNEENSFFSLDDFENGKEMNSLDLEYS